MSESIPREVDDFSEETPFLVSDEMMGLVEDLPPLPKEHHLTRKEMAAHALQAHDPEKLSQAEILFGLNNENHFYPLSVNEKNSALAIRGRLGEARFPTVKYLSEVYAHQLKADTDKPKLAVISIVESFYKYAQSSRGDFTLGQQLAEYTENISTDLSVPLLHQPTYKDWLNEGGLRRGLMNVARYKEISDFANGFTIESPLGKKNGINSSEGAERDARMQELIGALPLDKILAINEKVNAASQARYHYWKDQLTEATIFPEARAAAHDYLEKLS